MKDSLIKIHGQWESPAYLLYICISREQLASYSRMMRKSLTIFFVACNLNIGTTVYPISLFLWVGVACPVCRVLSGGSRDKRLCG